MAKTDDVHARFPPPKKVEFDKLKDKLTKEIPAAWEAPTATHLVGALLVLARKTTKRQRLAALETYRKETK